MALPTFEGSGLEEQGARRLHSSSFPHSFKDLRVELIQGAVADLLAWAHR